MRLAWMLQLPQRGQNLLTDGYEGTSPVGALPTNGYGLYDDAGNVWEWTGDFFTPCHPDEVAKASCVPRNPPGRVGRGEPRCGPTRREHPAPGAKGRLAPLRAQLLPALPAGGASGRGDRHLGLPHRLPLRGQGLGSQVRL